MITGQKAAEPIVRKTRDYAGTILDSLSAHVAVIDEHGVILETNRAWLEFAASNQVTMRPDMLNVNYLDVCARAHGDSAGKSTEVAEGIKRVIRGELEELVVGYPCHSPGEKRWFYMRAKRLVGSKPLKVVISHENITALKLTEERLKEREEELNRESTRLVEANAALRALLRQRDEDRNEIEETISRNLRETILPYLDQLERIEHNSEGAELIELIASGLNDIASPFLRRLSALERSLTPQEIQIAALVREGKSTKEIARLLSLSTTTINFHRRNLRAKLGLKNTSTNLRVHLLSLRR
jgi:DNA-binding CsgD family transcriptional regulator